MRPAEQATAREYPTTDASERNAQNSSAAPPGRLTLPLVETTPDPAQSGIQLGTVLSFIEIAVDALAGAREEIDALNVYPVPDGDTGTNLYLTMAAARDAVREHTGGRRCRPSRDLRGLHSRSAAGCARQLRGDPERDAARDHRPDRGRDAAERNAAVMVEALRKATEASYAAVGTPVEGTMLSVCRAAAEAAEALLDANPKPAPATCSPTSAAAARDALARTPDQLKVLKDAGRGRRRGPRSRGDPRRRRDCPDRADAAQGRGAAPHPAADRGAGRRLRGGWPLL